MIDTVRAETYLRLRMERVLLGDQSAAAGPMGDALQFAAAALCAVGALDREVAAAVLRDHALASAVRGRPNHAVLAGHAATPQHPARPPRVVAVEQAIERPAGPTTVHYVSLGDEATRIEVTLTLPPPGAGPSRAHPTGAHVSDDSGTNATAGFAGGGGGGQWRGCFAVSPALSRTTRHIVLDGVRIDLADNAVPATVEVEALPAGDPALAFVWRQLAAGPRGMMDPAPAIEAAVECLADAGALDPAAPEVQAARDVARALMGRGAAPPAAPQPWQDYLAGRGRAGGRTGLIAVGAQTPPVEGTVIVVEAVALHAGGFDVHVSVSPPIAGGMGRVGLDAPPPEWWAEDDAGGVHLGGLGSFSGTQHSSTGRVSFDPGVDRGATLLRIAPVIGGHRAVVAVPLP